VWRFGAVRHWIEKQLKIFRGVSLLGQVSNREPLIQKIATGQPDESTNVLAGV
jgi:hypothetical protein